MKFTQGDFFVTFPRFTIEQSNSESYTSPSGMALCEQYHSGLKRDMDLERLPLGKFATNALVMSCSGLAYKIMRAVGQVGLMSKAQARRAKQRRRVKPVIQNLIYCAARLIRHARGLTLRFSCHAQDQAEAFARTYARIAYG